MDSKDFIECAETAFSDLKINATQEQIEEVAQYFEQQVENSFDSRGETAFYGNNSESCKCESLKERITELENRLADFRKQIENAGSEARVWIGARSREIIIR
jgi:BMFP domain-containing protein YqiC